VSNRGIVPLQIESAWKAEFALTAFSESLPEKTWCDFWARKPPASVLKPLKTHVSLAF
jgi:hypothetical protein